MREILFRGKWDNDWIFGSLIYSVQEDIYYITEHNRLELSFPVEKETIGQFTGLFDKNGKKIFEGDIVKVVDENGEINELQPDTGIGAIEFLDGAWYISEDVDNGLYDIIRNYSIEVIGNKFDNPELVEVE